jgi:hypothetical protein
MHRVLTGAGRVTLSVFRGIEHHPFYQKLHNVILERFGMSGVEDIFALGDTEKLYKLMVDAGFQHIEIESVSMTAHFPNPEAFLAAEIDVDTAAIPSMQQLDAPARQAITTALSHAMQAPLREVTQDNQLEMQFHTHLARARH